MYSSPYLKVKDLEQQVSSLLASHDIYSLEQKAQNVASNIKQYLAEARLDIRDYELSETRDEQLKCANNGRSRLKRINKLILQASEHGLFGAVDVAELTAKSEQIIDKLY